MSTVQNITPDEAMRLLVEGNKRFVEGKPLHPHTDKARKEELVKGQSPFATILTCSDSRVPPELIFDRGIGDLFIVRVAGNIAAPTVMGSIVYATEHLACPLVVVMGHESCGAVTASLGSVADLAKESSTIVELIESIKTNVPNTLATDGSQPARIDKAIRENTKSVADSIREEPTIAARIADGGTVVREACYSLRTNLVAWFT